MTKEEVQEIEQLKKLVDDAYVQLDLIRKKSPNFDAGYKIDTGLARAIEALDKVKLLSFFDFRKLKFEGYHLDETMTNTKKRCFFESDDNVDNSIHIYIPEFVSIDNVSSDDYKYIAVVEILQDCQHYKTMVLDAKTWVEDVEEVGEDACYEDMAQYILTWGLNYGR